jgi:hypothetical protein
MSIAPSKLSACRGRGCPGRPQPLRFDRKRAASYALCMEAALRTGGPLMHNRGVML